jgi:hypothetical protein
MVSCALSAILATHIWINGYNQLVTVCEYRCSDNRTVQYAIAYGYDCAPNKRLQKT